MKTRIAALAALLCLAACSPSAPAANPSPDAGVLRAAEIRASGGADLYEIIAARRPGWLAYAVDSVGQRADSRVLVLVGGREVGDLRSLRGMDPAQIGTVRLESAEAAQQTTPALRGVPLNAVLHITTLTPGIDRARTAAARRGISILIGTTLSGKPADQALAGLEEEGYVPDAEDPANRSTDAGAGLLLQGGAWQRLSGPLRVELHVSSNTASTVAAQRVSSGSYLRGKLGSTEVDAMLSYGVRAGVLDLRAGAGPAIRVVNAEWRSRSPVDQGVVENSTTTGFGAAGTLTASTQISGPARVELNAFARAFPGQDPGTFRDRLDGVKMKGTALGLSIGLAYEFR